MIPVLCPRAVCAATLHFDQPPHIFASAPSTTSIVQKKPLHNTWSPGAYGTICSTSTVRQCQQQHRSMISTPKDYAQRHPPRPAPSPETPCFACSPIRKWAVVLRTATPDAPQHLPSPSRKTPGSPTSCWYNSLLSPAIFPVRHCSTLNCSAPRIVPPLANCATSTLQNRPPLSPSLPTMLRTDCSSFARTHRFSPPS